MGEIRQVGKTDTRSRIMRAAARLFSQRGYERTSVRQIAEAAGTAKPALYYYFKNKEDLCRILLREGMAELRDRLRREVKRRRSAKGKIQAIVRAHFEACTENLELARFLYATVFGPDDSPFSDDCIRFHEDVRDAVRDVLARIQTEGGLNRSADVAKATTTLQGQIQMWLMMKIKGRIPALTPALAGEITHTFLEGVGP